jgi:hypothetical protein
MRNKFILHQKKLKWQRSDLGKIRTAGRRGAVFEFFTE